MKWPTLRTYDRIDQDGHAIVPRGDFDKSYLGMRFIIGLIGMALPLLLVIFDAWVLDGAAAIRGSMSAYYHSAARDLFVGGLAACGVVLSSYLWWRWDTWDFWISLVAGVGVLGVAAFPTGRAGVDASATSCADPQAPSSPACSAVQQSLGEGTVELLHLRSSVLVVASFAALCLIFALRDFGYGVLAHELAGNRTDRLGVRKMWSEAKRDLFAHLARTPRTLLYLLCFVGVLVGAVWTRTGPYWLAPRGYVGEFIAFASFGFAWMVASWDLFRGLRGAAGAGIARLIAKSRGQGSTHRGQ